MADKRWVIWCRVVDNFGDIGVCWRLASQLHHNYNAQVTLWVDDLATFAQLLPAVANVAEQVLEGVTIRHWSATPALDDAPADVVIEAFACELPPAAIAAMRAQQRLPLWLNLEYLSAEPWVADCHGLPSPQGGGLNKYFFFPGFSAGTGGVLGEADLPARRAAWGPSQRDAWLRAQGVTAPAHFTLSLFAYENAALPALLEQWAASPTPINILVPQGRIWTSLQAVVGPLQVGQPLQHGAATIYPLPMRPQAEYDALLWSCDLNFVRGEDSFVRAQWAGLPLVWHIYPQEDAVHLIKLDAFIELYLKDAPADAAAALRALTYGWNHGDLAHGGVTHAWQSVVAHWPALRMHAQRWAAHLDALGNLAANLARFANARLK